MKRDKWLFPCDCGYGPGWYHSESRTRHEYNPDVPEEQATALKWLDRRNPGEFFLHISGDHVRAEISDYQGEACITKNSKNFYYRKWKTEEAACQAACCWVEAAMDFKIKPEQQELFA